MIEKTAVEWLMETMKKVDVMDWDLVFIQAKAMEKKQMRYTEEQAYEIWKAGQKYFETSGNSITFEELIEKFKSKSILQQYI